MYHLPYNNLNNSASILLPDNRLLCSENIMKIALWGEHATNFSIDSIYDAAAGNLIVCLVVGCIPREDFKNNGTAFFSRLVSTFLNIFTYALKTSIALEYMNYKPFYSLLLQIKHA